MVNYACGVSYRWRFETPMSVYQRTQIWFWRSNTALSISLPIITFLFWLYAIHPPFIVIPTICPSASPAISLLYTWKFLYLPQHNDFLVRIGYHTLSPWLPNHYNPRATALNELQIRIEQVPEAYQLWKHLKLDLHANHRHEWVASFLCQYPRRLLILGGEPVHLSKETK